MKIQGADSVAFKQATTVDIEPVQTFWYKPKGPISDLPTGHPSILIDEIYLAKNGEKWRRVDR